VLQLYASAHAEVIIELIRGSLTNIQGILFKDGRDIQGEIEKKDEKGQIFTFS